MARAMKDSGVEWLGDIPADWEICRIKNVASVFTGNSIKDEHKSFYEDPIEAIPYIATKDIGATLQTINFSNGMYVKQSDESFRRAPAQSTLLCIEGGNAGKKIAYTDREVCFVNKLCCFHSITCFNKYFYYQIMSPAFTEPFNSHIAGLIGGVSVNALKNFKILQPSLDEQQRIAAFLDGKCARIDSVVEKTRASIEEYRKLKQAIITRAVTKGIRPNRATKDSGIDWIGQIPADWKVCKLKHSIEWKSEKGQPNAVVLSLYRDYGVIPKNSRDDNHNVTSLDTSTYKVVSKGDFVINKMKAWQGSMAVSDYDGIVSPAYHVCKIIDSQIVLKYLHYLLRNQLYLPEYKRLSTGMRIGQWDLSFEDFKNLPFILPSQDEQKEIAAYLDEKTAVIDSLVAKKNRLVSELESLKKSLIFEYVTGKKEVPT